MLLYGGNLRIGDYYVSYLYLYARVCICIVFVFVLNLNLYYAIGRTLAHALAGLVRRGCVASRRLEAICRARRTRLVGANGQVGAGIVHA